VGSIAFVPGDLRAKDEPVGHTDVHEDLEGRDAGDGAVQNLSFLELGGCLFPMTFNGCRLPT